MVFLFTQPSPSVQPNENNDGKAASVRFSLHRDMRRVHPPAWSSVAAFTASPFATSTRCSGAERDDVHLAFRRQIEELLLLQVRKILALGIELLGELYALFLHRLMRLVRTADEVKIPASRDANLLVFSIQTDTEQFSF
jgi:hypothetical protein